MPGAQRPGGGARERQRDGEPRPMTPYLTFIGQCTDMLGFIIITWDVWPEYSFHRLSQDVYLYHESLRSFARKAKPREDIRALAESALFRMAQTQVDSLRRRLRLPPVTEGGAFPTPDQVERSVEETQAALILRKEAIAKRSRPPLGLGVACVLAGFALQAAGSWPQH